MELNLKILCNKIVESQQWTLTITKDNGDILLQEASKSEINSE